MPAFYSNIFVEIRNNIPIWKTQLFKDIIFQFLILFFPLSNCLGFSFLIIKSCYSDNYYGHNHCYSRHSSFSSPYYIFVQFYATALALILSITLLIPLHSVRSVNISTMLPWSVKGGSWRTDRSFIMPFWTIYSTIWLTK